MAAKHLSDKAQSVLVFLQNDPAANFTAKDIAAGIGLEARSVTGVINGLVKKGFVERIVVEGEKDKLVKLTSAGATVDPEAELAE